MVGPHVTQTAMFPTTWHGTALFFCWSYDGCAWSHPTPCKRSWFCREEYWGRLAQEMMGSKGQTETLQFLQMEVYWWEAVQDGGADLPAGISKAAASSMAHGIQKPICLCWAIFLPFPKERAACCLPAGLFWGLMAIAIPTALSRQGDLVQPGFRCFPWLAKRLWQQVKYMCKIPKGRLRSFVHVLWFL